MTLEDDLELLDGYGRELYGSYLRVFDYFEQLREEPDLPRILIEGTDQRVQLMNAERKSCMILTEGREEISKRLSNAIFMAYYDLLRHKTRTLIGHLGEFLREPTEPIPTRPLEEEFLPSHIRARSYDLKERVEEFYLVAELLWSMKEISGTYELDAQPRITGTISHMITELLVNATDATPEKGVIRLTARESEGPLLIEVYNSGSYIHPDKIPLILKGGYTTKEGKSTLAGEGKGRGLSSIKEIMEKDYLGSINIRSVEGDGTYVTLQFGTLTPQVF